MVRTGSERQVRRGPDGVEGTAEDRFGAEPGGNIRLFYSPQHPHPRTKQVRFYPCKRLVIVVPAGHSVSFPQIFQPFVCFAMVAVKFMQIAVEYAEITVDGERFDADFRYLD